MQIFCMFLKDFVIFDIYRPMKLFHEARWSQFGIWFWGHWLKNFCVSSNFSSIFVVFSSVHFCANQFLLASNLFLFIPYIFARLNWSWWQKCEDFICKKDKLKEVFLEFWQFQFSWTQIVNKDFCVIANNYHFGFGRSWHSKVEANLHHLLKNGFWHAYLRSV